MSRCMAATARKRAGASSCAPRVGGDGPPAIVAEGLTRRFGDFTAVDHVSFSIERGEIFGFLGSNGCGKTTTMKMLTGLLGISEGSAELLGRPVEASDLETRMRVGYMSQIVLALRGADGAREPRPARAALPHPGRRGRQRVDDALARISISLRSPTRSRRACRSAFGSGCSLRPPACTGRKC